MATRLKRVTATGAVHTGKAWLKSVILRGGTANSSVIVDDSTDGSGTDLLELAAVIGDSAVWASGDLEGVWMTTGIHATLAGAGASATFEYEV